MLWFHLGMRGTKQEKATDADGFQLELADFSELQARWKVKRPA